MAGPRLLTAEEEATIREWVALDDVHRVTITQAEARNILATLDAARAATSQAPGLAFQTILTVHYGMNHQSVAPGDMVADCTDDPCPTLYALSASLWTVSQAPTPDRDALREALAAVRLSVQFTDRKTGANLTTDDVAASLRAALQPATFDRAISDPATQRALDDGLADLAAGRVRPWKPSEAAARLAAAEGSLDVPEGTG